MQWVENGTAVEDIVGTKFVNDSGLPASALQVRLSGFTYEKGADSVAGIYCGARMLGGMSKRCLVGDAFSPNQGKQKVA